MLVRVPMDSKLSQELGEATSVPAPTSPQSGPRGRLTMPRVLDRSTRLDEHESTQVAAVPRLRVLRPTGISTERPGMYQSCELSAGRFHFSILLDATPSCTGRSSAIRGRCQWILVLELNSGSRDSVPRCRARVLNRRVRWRLTCMSPASFAGAFSRWNISSCSTSPVRRSGVSEGLEQLAVGPIRGWPTPRRPRSSRDWACPRTVDSRDEKIVFSEGEIVLYCEARGL